MALGWGIISTGLHPDNKIAPAMTAAEGAELVAVYSRDRGRAEAFAEKHGAQAAYDSLSEMLIDARVEAVFIASPNALHAVQSIAAAQAGKHVLSEKPMATTIEDSVAVITPVWPDGNVDAGAAFDGARQRLAEAVADLERSPPHRRGAGSGTPAPAEPRSNMEREAFHDMVKTAKEYIVAGDVLQVVLSQRFQVPFTLPPFALYRALRRLNPSPFLFFLDFGAFAVVGSSPEILVRVRGGKVTIRPIAGTRPRGATQEEDKALADELLADPKELAEHLMLLDLGRNDVGRVAKVGSVKVTQQMSIEHYSHVMHIVSNVEGDLDPQFDAMDALLAGFPAGTVSGAPKVRAMEIIDELESERRGVYAGCIGYFGANGEMDTCIALRTAVVKDGTMFVQAGGGIVADSDPESEYQESRNKALALIRAAQEAVRFAAGGG